MRVMWNMALAAWALGACLTTAAAVAQEQPADAGTDSWSNWTGAYAGAGVGGALLGSKDDNGIPAVTSRAKHDDASPEGDLRLGYNFIANQIFFGIEGDVAIHKNRSLATPNPPIYGAPARTLPGTLVNTTKSDWSASILARLGLPMGMAMPYITGGVTWSDIKLVNSYTAFPGATQSQDDVVAGWTVGGGIEFLIARGVSWRIEGLHTEYDKIRFTNTDPGQGNIAGGLIGVGTVYTRTNQTTQDVVRTGLSFRF